MTKLSAEAAVSLVARLRTRWRDARYCAGRTLRGPGKHGSVRKKSLKFL